MPDVLKAISVALVKSVLNVGESTPAVATVAAEVTDGSLTDDFPLTWSSSNPAVATVSTTAPTTVTAVGAGTAVITAKNGLIVGSATVSVVGLPFVDITAAGQAVIEGLPLGAKFELRGLTASFVAQKNAS